jgi:hypothetical protein
VDKLVEIILKPSFVLILSIVAVYAIFLSAILQLSSQLSSRSRLATSPQQVLGETSLPGISQTPSGLLARNQRCIGQQAVNIDLFWQQSSWASGYWIALFADGRWQTRWMGVRTPTSDGWISLTWENLNPGDIYYWTITAQGKSGFSPWAPIQYFQTSWCR